MTTRRRSPRPLAPLLGSLVVLALVAAGCGSSDQGDDDGKKAAEPATSPALSAKPAGTVTDIGAAPQGIVYDAKTDKLAVAVRKPYRLLVVDPDTLKVERSVEVPGKVRHLQVSEPGGSVLVPSETANRLYQVPLDGGKITHTDVPEHPHDATGESGFVISGNEFDGSISVLKSGQIVKTIGDLKQPGGVIGDGDGTVSAVDVGDYTVTTYSLRTLKRIARVPAGKGPTHGVLAADNRLAVTDTRGNQVLLYSLDPLKQIGAVDAAGSPYGLTADPTTGTVWVTLTGKNKLVGYRVQGEQLKKVAEYDTVEQPDTVAVNPGSTKLWVTGTEAGVVQTITR